MRRTAVACPAKERGADADLNATEFVQPYFLCSLVCMNAHERRLMDDAMAKISQMKKAVEADRAGTVQTSLDASMAQAKRLLLRILFWVALAAVAAAI